MCPKHICMRCLGSRQCWKTNPSRRSTTWEHGISICHLKCPLAFQQGCHVWYVNSLMSRGVTRFASIYKYDKELFAARFLGPPGVSCLSNPYNIAIYYVPAQGDWKVLGTSAGHRIFSEPSYPERSGDLATIGFCFNMLLDSCLYNEATDLSRCVPLIHHADDGEAHRRRSFMVCTFGSALIHGSPFDSRYLLYCTDNSRSCSNTYDTLDHWIAWSFTELGTGRSLQRSPWGEEMGFRKSKAGNLIADGWKGILFAFRGDEKALAKTFHVRSTWVSPEVCFSCQASRRSNSRYLYTAFGRNALHRTTMLTLHDFVVNKCDASAWLRVPGFHPSMLIYDWLHVLDLTLIPDAAASVTRLQPWWVYCQSRHIAHQNMYVP